MSRTTLTETTTATPEAPAKPQTPKERLFDLEGQAQKRGMSLIDLADMQSIGECNEQIARRILLLEQWLANAA